ncbi:MAG: type VI secretion system tip protein TssI/VgrG, partial [Pseudomonadota bacterium]
MVGSWHDCPIKIQIHLAVVLAAWHNSGPLFFVVLRVKFMADGAVQKSRLVKLTSPLGPDGLLFYKMSGTEAVSQLFEWEIEALAQDDYIEEDQVVGHGCTVEIECADDVVRYFHGLCTEISLIGGTGRRNHYAITLRPHLWFLSLQSDSRIFSKMTVGDIIAEVLDTAGLTDFEIALTADYEVIPYCVQYQESNFDFVCRLMEKYGIVYFFKHKVDKHTLVLSDSISQFEPAPGAETLTYNANSGLLFSENFLSRVRLSEQIVTDTIDADEYNYETVGRKLKVNRADLGSHGMTGNALYDFRTSYLNASVGEQLTKISLEAERAKTKRVMAEGVAPAIFAGCRLKIAECPLPGTDKDLTCLAVHHEIRSDSYGTVMAVEPGGNDGDVFEELYNGKYILMP